MRNETSCIIYSFPRSSVVTSKPATGQARDHVLLPLCLLIRQVHFGSPTARATFEHVTVMEEAVEHCGDGGAVTEQLSPVLHFQSHRERTAIIEKEKPALL